MKFLLAQLIPAGPGGDGEGWMNILFVVVLAVFWVVGGIIKATSKKPQDRRSQPPPRKPAGKIPSPAGTRESSDRPTRTTQPRVQPRPRQAAQAAHLDKTLRSKIVEAARTSESSLVKPQEGSILKDFPEFTSKPLTELGPMHLDTPQRTREVEDLPDLVLDYSDPDELSKAILQYEILGPPVSLRPSHQITGF